MSVVGIIVIVAFVALVVCWLVLTHRKPLYRRGQKVPRYGNQRTENPDFFPGQGDAGGM